MGEGVRPLSKTPRQVPQREWSTNLPVDYRTSRSGAIPRRRMARFLNVVSSYLIPDAIVGTVKKVHELINPEMPLGKTSHT